MILDMFLSGHARLRNDLDCVGWSVKLYSLTHSLWSCVNAFGDNTVVCQFIWSCENGSLYNSPISTFSLNWLLKNNITSLWWKYC